MSLDPLSSSQFTQAVFNNPPPEESEDCLYLNVYAPATPPGGAGRAVMFWIYGGSLQFGNAGQDTYDGSSFAAYEDVIVVTTNYRTNGKMLPKLGKRLLPFLTTYSVRLSCFTGTATSGTQSRLSGPTFCSRLGSEQHPRFRWRCFQSDHFWRKCGCFLD